MCVLGKPQNTSVITMCHSQFTVGRVCMQCDHSPCLGADLQFFLNDSCLCKNH